MDTVAPQNRTFVPSSVTRRAQPAVERLIERSPGFASIAFWVRYHDSPINEAPSGISTYGWANSKEAWFTPRFDDLSPEEQVGVVAHELLHVALQHSTRAASLALRLGEAFKPKVFNFAADGLINDGLHHHSWLRLPEGGVYLQPILDDYVQLQKDLGRPEIKLRQGSLWSVEEVYHFLIRLADELKGLPPGSSPSTADGSDDKKSSTAEQRLRSLVNAMKDPGDLILERLESMSEADRQDLKDQLRDWQQRLELARAGDRAGGILRSISGDLPRTTTPWEDILGAELRRALQVEPSYTSAKPSRRWSGMTALFDPGHMGWERGMRLSKPTTKVVLCIDTSGSIDDRLLSRFISEVEKIRSVTKAACVLIACDADVHQVLKYAPDEQIRIDQLKLGGGGGTDFGPAIAEALNHDPDVIVYLTDLCGPCGPNPGAPVLWAVLDSQREGGGTPPFGKVVSLRD